MDELEILKPGQYYIEGLSESLVVFVRDIESHEGNGAFPAIGRGHLHQFRETAITNAPIRNLLNTIAMYALTGKRPIIGNELFRILYHYRILFTKV